MTDLIPYDDPNRCERRTPYGQCESKALSGSRYCEEHGGLEEAREVSHREHLLEAVRYREELTRDINQYSQHEALLSLKEEIALMRVTYNRHLDKLQSDDDLLASTVTLQSLALTLEKLITSWAKMAQQLNEMVPMDVAYALARKWVSITGEELKANNVPGYEEIVDTITKRIQTTLDETKE